MLLHKLVSSTAEALLDTDLIIACLLRGLLKLALGHLQEMSHSELHSSTPADSQCVAAWQEHDLGAAAAETQSSNVSMIANSPTHDSSASEDQLHILRAAAALEHHDVMTGSCMLSNSSANLHLAAIQQQEPHQQGRSRGAPAHAQGARPQRNTAHHTSLRPAHHNSNNGPVVAAASRGTFADAPCNLPPAPQCPPQHRTASLAQVPTCPTQRSSLITSARCGRQAMPARRSAQQPEHLPVGLHAPREHSSKRSQGPVTGSERQQAPAAHTAARSVPGGGQRHR